MIVSCCFPGNHTESWVRHGSTWDSSEFWDPKLTNGQELTRKRIKHEVTTRNGGCTMEILPSGEEFPTLKKGHQGQQCFAISGIGMTQFSTQNGVIKHGWLENPRTEWRVRSLGIHHLSTVNGPWLPARHGHDDRRVIENNLSATAILSTNFGPWSLAKRRLAD